MEGKNMNDYKIFLEVKCSNCGRKERKKLFDSKVNK